MPTGRITEWNDARGFGYLESGNRRVFIHIRDFADRERRPVVGDSVTFVLGVDKQGRTCAQQAILLGAAGRVRLAHGLILVFLILPGVAIHRLSGFTGLGYGATWVAVISIIAYVIYAADKRRARVKGQREPERHLHLLALLGGWPGAFFAQRKYRHKSSKGPFMFVFVLIVGLYQFLAIDAIRGWPFIHGLRTLITRLNQ